MMTNFEEPSTRGRGRQTFGPEWLEPNGYGEFTTRMIHAMQHGATTMRSMYRSMVFSAPPKHPQRTHSIPNARTEKSRTIDLSVTLIEQNALGPTKTVSGKTKSGEVESRSVPCTSVLGVMGSQGRGWQETREAMATIQSHNQKEAATRERGEGTGTILRRAKAGARVKQGALSSKSKKGVGWKMPWVGGWKQGRARRRRH